MSKIIELIDDFRLNQEIQDRKPEYVTLCLYRLNRWNEFMLDFYSITEVEDVKPMHLKKYIQHCQHLGKEKQITINGSLSTLRVFFNYLVNEEFIDEFDNPIRRIKNLKEEKRVIRTFNDDEVQRIIGDVAEETYSNVRDKLILIMLFDTGIRVSELCTIKVEDVSTRHILIHGKGSKQRLIYISKIMRRYMRKYEVLKTERFKHKHPDEIEDFYFLDQCAEKLSRSRINKILKQHCANAGVRKEVRCSPHDCRHYFAQKQLKNGIDVYSLSRLLGHYDTQITSNYLRGLEQDTILEMGRIKSPLNKMKIK
ncbi:recombinase [Lysinibacillus contaminans]|uniref:Recombinase n=1 Tax=Lysinibacillus contaminans TaxID=1293441 RepID=A0ABR5JYA2_9BACI|nr:tyrosine-type recombinase/integrase [Lysinibacillus contaminans]KOS67125.1 recombinase [Lysinibacillus contaminans]